MKIKCVKCVSICKMIRNAWHTKMLSTLFLFDHFWPAKVQFHVVQPKYMLLFCFVVMKVQEKGLGDGLTDQSKLNFMMCLYIYRLNNLRSYIAIFTAFSSPFHLPPHPWCDKGGGLRSACSWTQTISEEEPQNSLKKSHTLHGVLKMRSWKG